MKAEELRIGNRYPIRKIEKKYIIHREGYLENINTGHILRFVKTAKGYCTVRVRIQSIEHRVYLHRLIAEKYIPNPENLECVIHKDGDRNNNRVSNLKWGENKRSKKDWPNEMYNLFLTGNYSMDQLAQKYNVCKPTISVHLSKRLRKK